jgi:hypothetical protein
VCLFSSLKGLGEVTGCKVRANMVNGKTLVSGEVVGGILAQSSLLLGST